MADPRFHNRSGPFTLGQLAALSGATLASGVSADKMIADVAPLDTAAPDCLSFLDNIRYRDQFRATKAGACIVAPDMAPIAPPGIALLLTPAPYKAYAQAAQAFYPVSQVTGHIHAAAHVDPAAVLGAGCVVEAGAVVMRGAEIGPACWIEANAIIGENVRLGRNCRVGAGAGISHSLIGDNVRIYPGVRIGQDGFGFAIDAAGFVKVPQLGRVIIEDSVEIGANSTIDRGSGPDTVIGQGTWIDNLVQIGHNVKIGKNCIMVAQSGVSGSSVLEDYVVVAGQTGIAGHLRIGKGARIAGHSGVMRDVPAGQEQMGYPAVPLRQFMKQIALLGRLVRKGKEG